MKNPFETLNDKLNDQNQGLTKRELIAAMCLHAILSSSYYRSNESGATMVTDVEDAVRYTDMLLEELSK